MALYARTHALDVADFDLISHLP
ncbi:MAG: hypothetical protein RLZZ359_839, partial [Actinomycetota bacterium]